jgi:hypothetical protein
MGAYPIRERRRKATRSFYWKVAFLSLIMAVIAWTAWLAPWARTRHAASVEISR